MAVVTSIALAAIAIIIGLVLIYFGIFGGKKRNERE